MAGCVRMNRGNNDCGAMHTYFKVEKMSKIHVSLVYLVVVTLGSCPNEIVDKFR